MSEVAEMHAEHNFDHPDAFDVDSMVSCLGELKVSGPLVPVASWP